MFQLLYIRADVPGVVKAHYADDGRKGTYEGRHCAIDECSPRIYFLIALGKQPRNS